MSDSKDDSTHITLDPDTIEATMPKDVRDNLKFTPLNSGPPEQQFWLKFSEHWDQLYTLISSTEPSVRYHALELMNGMLSEEAFKHIQLECTFGELNRTALPRAKALVELYISPRLRRDNVPLMEKYFNTRPKHLPNLAIYKYRAYNPKDALIEDIVYPAEPDVGNLVDKTDDKTDNKTDDKTDEKHATYKNANSDNNKEYTARYTDLGYQSSVGYDDETKLPVLNLAIYVKKQLADRILAKRTVTFRDPRSTLDNPIPDIKMDKWLPTKSTAVDVLLMNVLGEFNLIHRIGYIEFLPEGDPLIASGSVFSELADLRNDILSLEKSINYTTAAVSMCKYCNRHSLQCGMLRCTRCKSATYCSVMCQKGDFSQHKKICREPTAPQPSSSVKSSTNVN